MLPSLPPEFLSASGDEVVDVANDYLEKVFRGCDGNDEDRVIKELPAPLADLWILGWLDFEVTQGGLATYFINSHGRQAPRAVEALRRIGADDIADCLEQARALVAKHEAAWERRNEELDARGEYAVVRPFEDLEGVDELRPVAERFDHLWFDRVPSWGELMNDHLDHYRRGLLGR